MEHRIKTVKTEYHYEVFDAPDTEQLWGRKYTIRPERITVHLERDQVSVVVVEGSTVRKDFSLGAWRAVAYGGRDFLRGQVPNWIVNLLRDESLSWEPPTPDLGDVASGRTPLPPTREGHSPASRDAYRIIRRQDDEGGVA